MHTATSRRLPQKKLIINQKLFYARFETAFLFLHQFSDPLRSLCDISLIDYPHIQNIYLSEPTKSMDGTLLVHFSLEVLC